MTVPLELTGVFGGCVEAIRCSSLSRAAVMLVPRLEFAFRPVPAPAPVRPLDLGRKTAPVRSVTLRVA